MMMNKKERNPQTVIFETHVKGVRFGFLVALEELPSDYSKKNKAIRNILCICNCGNKRSYRLAMLRYGHTKSCGCIKQSEESRRNQSIRARTHGMTDTVEFKTWVAMKKRCTNPSYKNYPLYGGRGITVCKEWYDSFETFYKDLGPRPSPKHSIDRIDVNGNYEPSNCKWSTNKEQSRNKRNNHNVTYNGETKCISAWAEQLGIRKDTLRLRLKQYSPEIAFKKNFRTRHLEQQR